MGRLSNEEAKKKHVRELTTARVKRFYENQNLKMFSARISEERYKEITDILKERGITQKQFIENAIDQFLKESE